jgi:hypothetical protein
MIGTQLTLPLHYEVVTEDKLEEQLYYLVLGHADNYNVYFYAPMTEWQITYELDYAALLTAEEAVALSKRHYEGSLVKSYQGYAVMLPYSPNLPQDECIQIYNGE